MPFFSSVTHPFIPAGSLPTMIGVQSVPSRSPDCQVIGTAAPCGWLPRAKAKARRDQGEATPVPASGLAGQPIGGSPDGHAEQVWLLVIRGVDIDGGWVLRGGEYFELGDTAEWMAGWMAQPAGDRAERRW